jgi:hypothetical protein
VVVEVLVELTDLLDELVEIAGLALERILIVASIPAARKELLVLGVGDEQKSIQHDERYFVDLVKFFLRRILEITSPSDGLGEIRDDIVVDTLPKAIPEVGGAVLRPLHDVVKDPIVAERVRGEQEPEVRGLVGE